MTDGQHLSKAKSVPIKYLKACGKGFFAENKEMRWQSGMNWWKLRIMKLLSDR